MLGLLKHIEEFSCTRASMYKLDSKTIYTLGKFAYLLAAAIENNPT